MIFLARATDLERLFSAKSICYLVGGYDGSGNYGDIMQLLGALDILGQFSGRMLVVPLLYYEYIQSFNDLYQQNRDSFGDACFLYYDWKDLSGDVLRVENLERISHPPSVYSQIFIYGGGFFTSRWMEGQLDIIQNLERWVTFDGKVGGVRVPPPIICGQQVSPGVLACPEGDRLVDLLKRAALVGVRDHISYKCISDLGKADINEKLFLSHDDSLEYIAASIGAKGYPPQPEPARAERESHPLTMNVHFSLEDYVTERPDHFLATVSSIIKNTIDYCDGEMTINFLIAYEDRRISESRFVEQLLQGYLPEAQAMAHTVCLNSQLQNITTFAQADWTVSSSYHVALSSLLSGVPTFFIYDNDYYYQKAAGLKEQFHIGEEFFFDNREEDHSEFYRALKQSVEDRGFGGRFRGSIYPAVINVVNARQNARILVTKHLLQNLLREVDYGYESLGRELLESLQRLSTLQADYTSLLNASSHIRPNLDRQIEDLRSQLRYYEQLRFRLVERLFTALGKRRFLHPLIRFLYGLVRRIV